MANDNMATVSYGGVEFEMRKTNAISRAAVFSPNNTYLYTKWTFDFTAVYSPEATSYVVNANRFPFKRSGQHPVVTDESLRHYLSQPRQRLIYRFGDKTLLETPAVGRDGRTTYKTDACNGPLVEECSVTQTSGFRVFVVSMKITACVNECQRDIPVLSHTWKRSADYDRDQYCVVMTEGTAIFRSDVLLKLGTWPDIYRSDFLHPVPSGFRRERIYVVAEEDAVTYHYLTLDRQIPFGTDGSNPRGIPVHFEGLFSAGVKQTGSSDANVGFVQEGLAAFQNFGSNMVTAMSSGDSTQISKGTGAVAAGLEFGRAAGAAVINRHLAQIPRYQLHGWIRAWGGPDSDRLSMIHWAIAILGRRLDLTGDGRERTNTYNITEMLHDKYIEVDMDQSWSLYPEIDLATLIRVGTDLFESKAVRAAVNTTAINILFPITGVVRGIFGLLPEPGNAIAAVLPPDAVRDVPVAEEGWVRTFQNAANDVLRPAVIPPRSFTAGPGNLPPDATVLDVLLNFFPQTGDSIEGLFRGHEALVGLVRKNNRFVPIVSKPLKGNRGSFIANLLAQTLSNPCELPPQPPQEIDGFVFDNAGGKNPSPKPSSKIPANLQTKYLNGSPVLYGSD